MDTNTIIWGISFPLLLFFIALGAGTAFAMTSSESTGFLVAKACFAAAAFDAVAVAVYWATASQQRGAWGILVPTIAALIVVPGLVLSLQWLGRIEVQLSTRLYPGDGPTPPLPFEASIPKDALQVFMGSNVMWTNKMPQTILMMGGEKMIEVDRDPDKNQLVVSTLKIFDDRNNIIARVDAEDGFWVENSTRKKRPDPSTLVVYDHADAEVLRMVFINPTTLSIMGIFRHAGFSKPVVVTTEYIDLVGKGRTSNSIMSASGHPIINIR